MRTVSFADVGVPLMSYIPVYGVMEKLQSSYPKRRDDLVEILGIYLNWIIHQLSEVQRSRVRIMIGMIQPFKVLLLYEITTSLDVCVRLDLLHWLIKESN